MLDIKLIREKPQEVKKAVESKGYAAPIDKILKLDKKKRELQKQLDDLRAKKNETSKQIVRVSADLRQQLIADMKRVDEQTDKFVNETKEINNELQKLLLLLPNLPAPDVKVGESEKQNEVIKIVGKPPKFSFSARDHLELGKTLDIIDTERASKVSGSRFGYLRNEAALLEFALIKYALDKLLKNGFKPIIPPAMVTDEIMRATGHLMPGEETERYFYPEDKLYLVGTSEQSVVPMHKDEVFNEKDLPLRYAAFSTCFRREAGSYGKDVKGILRVHQFDKLEMISFTTAENSDKEHEFLLSSEKEIMDELGLPYRVVKMCTGDLGATAARKYDLEAWLPSQNTYRETHSTSNCTDFQARRLNIRLRRGGKMEFVHTLNGTAVAIGRMLIAILENYQKKDGSVEIPKALQKYMGLKKIDVQK